MENLSIKNPPHYKGVEGLEVIEVMKNFLPKYDDPFISAMVFNVIKYVLRAPAKNNLLEDLKKARVYLNYAIENSQCKRENNNTLLQPAKDEYRTEVQLYENHMYLIDKVKSWFVERNLDSLDGSGQITKMFEEVAELQEAFGTKNRQEEIDAVGDIFVVLIGYCMQRNLDPFACLHEAYNQIKDRKGKVINGVFVKESDL